MKSVITVVSLGPGDPSLLTLQTADALRHAKRLMLRTEQHPVAAWLKEQGIPYVSFDPYYDHFWDFDELNQAIARKLWEEAAMQPVTYAVMDATGDSSLSALDALRPEDGRLVRLAGVSRADACLCDVPARELHADGLRVLPALSCAGAVHDPHLPLLITEMDNPALAGDVKLWLSDLYDEEMSVTFFPSSVKGSRKAVSMPLMELDRQKTYDHTVSVYVPAVPLQARQRFCFADLVEIMDILRGEHGCPWDREQTHQSLRKYLIEEAYETVAAIDEDDPDHIADELGDVLLQVVFHAHVGKSHGNFTISDVTTDICRKMIYRHAHIFGTAQCATSQDVSRNWEQLKKAEKHLTTQGDVLADVSRGLPALMRAAKVQKKAAQVGFDWDSAEEALPKVTEEAQEVQAELSAHRDPGEELGDLLFSCVNVARLCGKDPEEMLTQATEKFIRRFQAMENLIISDGKTLEGLTLAEMDVYWSQVKLAQSCCHAT
ncbi:MAG: nucleoside triphosphate pyrophosphohydrolase [Aristaeellaceae bacterium]